VEYRWQRDDSIFRSIYLSSVTISSNIDSTRLNVQTIESWKISLMNWNKQKRYLAHASICLVFRNLQVKNIRKNTNKVIFYLCFVNAYCPTKICYSSSYIFLRYQRIKADTFAWPSFLLWTKRVPVVMSEFSTPRAKRSQRNRYADATFYFSKRIAFGFSGFTEQ